MVYDNLTVFYRQLIRSLLRCLTLRNCRHEKAPQCGAFLTFACG
ncbi:hypothetical protein BaLi_c16120 [Bacillus paralicheniformis ATCC 9945a]|nr:hypothetical protein BaLi_c16120 [Bacillus paralicheniformis ATCC 9945a]